MLFTSRPRPHLTITTVSNVCTKPTTASTVTLLVNQDAPFLGRIAGSTSGNTIEINNAPTNKPREIKYGAKPVP